MTAAPTGPEPRRAGLSPAIRAELADVATDLEWAATKQDRPDVALGFRAAAARVRERLEDDEMPEPRRDAAVELDDAALDCDGCVCGYPCCSHTCDEDEDE